MKPVSKVRWVQGREGLEGLLRALLLVLSTSDTALTHITNLTVDPWPEDTTAGMSNGGLKVTVSSM